MKKIYLFSLLMVVSLSTAFGQFGNCIVNAIGTNVSCFDACDGSASATAFGGTAPYTYVWSPGNMTGANVSGLCAGSYTVTITDAKGCTKTSQPITITEPTKITLAMSNKNVSCNGGNDGSATVSATGGSPGYTYSWNTNPVQTTATASGLTAGIYTVTVKDAKGCEATGTDTITEPAPILITTSSVDASCGKSDGQVSATASNSASPYTYSWNTNPIQTNDTASNIPAGVYTVTVTDNNNCSKTASVAVNNINGPVLSTSSSNVSCFGGSNGTASTQVSGGTSPYSYSWNTNPVQTNDTATDLIAGTYTITVTDSSGCIGEASVVITEPTPLAATISQTNVTCKGDSNGTATIAVSGGTPSYTYTWSTTPAQTEDMAINLKAGTYSVTANDFNGCKISKSVTISEPATGMSLTSTKTNVTCNGGSDGSIAVKAAGGSWPYTYSWNTNPVQTTATASALTAGIYTATVTDAKNCAVTKTDTIIQPSAIALTTGVLDANCGQADGQASVTALGGTPGYTYSWNTNPAQTTATASTLPAGVYTVTVTDKNSCVKAASVTVNNLNGPVVTTTSSNVSCFGGTNGTASAQASGGTSPYTYSWDTNPVQTNDTATALIAGTYTVTVTDKSACVGKASVTITQPARIAATTSQTNVSCKGGSDGSATVSVSGGTASYTYSWSTNPVQTTATATGLTAGADTVMIKDANGCELSKTVTITEPSAISLSSTKTNLTCNGGSDGSIAVNSSGGVSPYSYSWNTNPVQTTATASALAAGIYTVTVTDANKCVATKTDTLKQPAAMSLTTAVLDANCGQADGQASVTALGGTPGYTYSWNTNPVQATSTASALPVGVYTVTVTDNNKCVKTASATINNLNGPVVATSATHVSCYGGTDGTVSAQVSGGTSPYTYSWNTNPVQTNETATALTAGVYTATVTDKSGCVGSASVTITQPNVLAVAITATDATCAGCKDGSATATVSGGTSSYSYSWSPSGGTGSTATGLGAGTYKVCVSDIKGCSVCDSIEVKEQVVTGLVSAGTKSSINVYPNPSNGSFIISLNSSSNQTFSIKIFSPIGQLVSDQQLEISGTNQAAIDISHAAKGIYVLRIQSDKEVFTKRLFIK